MRGIVVVVVVARFFCCVFGDLVWLSCYIICIVAFLVIGCLALQALSSNLCLYSQSKR